jgi:hypothetical protein
MSNSRSLCVLVSIKPGPRFDLGTHALIDIVLNNVKARRVRNPLDRYILYNGNASPEPTMNVRECASDL